jgi:hypothetical protein
MTSYDEISSTFIKKKVVVGIINVTNNNGDRKIMTYA